MTVACSEDPVTEPLPPIPTLDIVVGTGDTINAGDTAVIHLLGYVTSTFTLFVSSYEQGAPYEFVAGTYGRDAQGRAILPNGQSTDPFTLTPTPIPRAMAEGMVGMRVGGRRYITVPGRLGYGGCPGERRASIVLAVPNCAQTTFEVLVLSKR